MAIKSIRFKAVRARALGPPTGEDWLIKGLLPKEGIGTFFGNSGTYKSFSAINIALHVATGEPWAGRKVIQADAVYVASEGAAGAAKRINGAMEANGADDPPLYLISKPVNFGTGTEDAGTLIVDLEAQGIEPGCIVVDTLSASMAGGDENGPGMAMFLMNARRSPSISDASSCPSTMSGTMARSGSAVTHPLSVTSTSASCASGPTTAKQRSSG